MAFFSVISLAKWFIAFQLICVVLMVGSFDSAKSNTLGLEVPEVDLVAAATPPKPLRRPMIRRPIAVQGVVFCKSCKVPSRINTFTPLQGAIVRLLCNNGRRSSFVTEGKTDKNGYFFIQPRNVTNLGARKCKVFLVSSPLGTCKKPTNVNGGLMGSQLRFEKDLVGLVPIALFTTGPFAFGPISYSSCLHSP